LPVLRHGLKSDVVCKKWTAERAGAFEKQIIGQLIVPILLSRQDIDRTKAQLCRDGVINVNVAIESDWHRLVAQIDPRAFSFNQSGEGGFGLSCSS